ncbi:2OG-Fe(II) oxygenase family protein [Algihabitans albus]|uniref:2OG-Fe(II) oxygenase family protein n=1 Tax=Algihabitans albus TaxID=2164067 RepID=UPI000E5D4B9C|nr:2OG-Fe(II) oxygenase family protein [Algihabitans albus]
MTQTTSPPKAAASLMPVFATPIGQFSVPAAARLNPAIRATVLERETAMGGVARSNAGGWHSRADLLDWGLAEIDELAETVQQAALAVAAPMAHARKLRAEVTMQAWANVTRRGNYNKIHDHPGWHLSAVYYVDAGEIDPDAPPQSGWIEFVDPRGAMGAEPPGVDPDRPVRLPGRGGALFGNIFALPPINGGLLIFPSWLRHWVHPYAGDAERISLAFNLRLEDAQPVD